ncbi:GspH/FimT family pseudopilin [Sphingosinicella terrae]|uniref:GspH/FimT family pseudopilin n=1 Tax=Sphingosinicella terrae TaxID=2172047 RepID=UPI000E0D5379|nr:GspH/FimT family pseudopilin [Sphingosinicella terrae]
MTSRSEPEPAGASRRRVRPGTAGFTMVELMVVIVIIGLAAAAVVLAMPDPGGSLRSEAERFAARAKAARDTAIVEARPTLLRIDSAGYALARRGGGTWRESDRWSWVEGTSVMASGSGEGGIRFDSTGLAQPAQITLSRRDRRVGVAIGQDGEIHVLP